MHISSTETLLPSAHAAVSAPSLRKSTPPSEWIVLVPMATVCTLLALLEAVATIAFDPDLLRIIPG